MSLLQSRFGIYAAVACAGAASLLLELSLLREFTYVIGSTAITNSLIISIYLAGLTAGAALGARRRAARSEEGARAVFCRAQAGLILYIFSFVWTKGYFVYFCPQPVWTVAYFFLAAWAPSLLSGLAYAAAVNLLYARGQKEVVDVYVWSTLGSVVGGLLHGFVFSYFMGLNAVYTFSVVCALIAILLARVGGASLKRRGMLACMLIGVVACLACSDGILRMFYRLDNRIFQKKSPAGLVEVWRMDRRGTVRMMVHNLHQYYSTDWDYQAHVQWADLTLGLVNRPSDVLLLGYGSGVSTAAYLRSNQVTRVDTIENASPVMEAGREFFPEEFRLASQDPRSRVTLEDFRHYVRFCRQTYDIILLDHSVTDPYSAGFFTLEFFDQLRRILKPGGVVAMYGIGLTWDTTHQAFPYIYRNRDPRVSPIIRQNGVFLSMTPFEPSALAGYERLQIPTGHMPVFRDHSVQGVTWEDALRVAGFHIQNLLKPRNLSWIHADA